MLAAGFDSGEHRFDEAAARGALRAEGELAPDDGVPQRAFAGVVRRFDAVVLEKGPKPVAMRVQFAAHAGEQLVPARRAPFEQRFDPSPDRAHATNQRASRDRAVAKVGPVLEQAFRRRSQSAAEPRRPAVAAVDQFLKVPLQMRPAPLQLRQRKIHSRAIARDNARELVPQQVADAGRLARAAHGKEREAIGHVGPKPGLVVLFFGRRFVDREGGLPRQRGGQFVVRRSQRGGRLVLQLHDPAGRTGLAEDLFQEERRTALALAITAHQERDERHEPRPGRPGRNAFGKFRAGLCTARAIEPMPLVFAHERLDFRQFPHLMPQWFGVVAGQFFAAPSALGWLERLHVVARFGRNQRPFVFLVARLAAPLSLRLPPLGLWLRLGVRMLRARRQRRVLGIQSALCLKLPNPFQQQFDKRPDRRRHLGLKLRRNRNRDWVDQRHDASRLLQSTSCPDQSEKKRPQGVNGYP